MALLLTLQHYCHGNIAAGNGTRVQYLYLPRIQQRSDVGRALRRHEGHTLKLSSH
jgi:hypothetical protein